ncbi:UDP-N-acetylmuramoyl-L-alanyl-D-glutamate--2,6-diaminopimelate ligase [Endothiovibrio diazotrophicus]
MVALERHPGMRLSRLLEGFAAVPPALDCLVSGLAGDSRQVRHGDLFFARQGGGGHGLSHLEGALRNGAAAVAWEPAEGVATIAPALSGTPLIAVPGLSRRAGEIAARFYGEPASGLFTIGVTGTNGKTSVAAFVAQALNAGDGRCGLIGTVGYGLPGRMVEASHTTPDALRLHELLADFLARGADSVAMEVSSHGLAQGRVAGVAFDVALFTNLSRDHLDYHGDMAAYGAAKERLFLELTPACAVINADDPFGRQLLGQLAAKRIECFGYSVEEKDECAIRGMVAQTDRGMTIAVTSPWGEGVIESALLGRFNASNLLAALGALGCAGVAIDEACRRLSAVAAVAGRMERFGGGDQPLVVVDYAHTPDALAKSLEALRGHCGGRLSCVFGCGGERDRGKRPEMGRVAERLADRVVVTDDNPRSEEGAAIVAEILAGMEHPEAATVERDRGRAIAAAVAQAAPGDVVLVAGKGHENYQQVGAERRPFSDCDAVRAALIPNRAVRERGGR